MVLNRLDGVLRSDFGVQSKSLRMGGLLFGRLEAFGKRRVNRYHGKQPAGRTAWHIPSAFPCLDRLFRYAQELSKRRLGHVGCFPDSLYFFAVILPDRCNSTFATHGSNLPAASRTHRSYRWEGLSCRSRKRMYG